MDLNKKRQQRCASSGGVLSGLGLSGPVNSMMQQRFPDANRLSLSGLTRTTPIRDSRVDSGSVDMETPLSLSPKSPLVEHHMDNEAETAVSSKKPIPPPRTRLPRKDYSAANMNGGSEPSTSSLASPSSPLSCSLLSGNGQCPSVSTLSGLSDAETYAEINGGPTTALGELSHAIDQAIASMTAAASEHSDYDVPKPPRSLKVQLHSAYNTAVLFMTLPYQLCELSPSSYFFIIIFFTTFRSDPSCSATRRTTTPKFIRRARNVCRGTAARLLPTRRLAIQVHTQLVLRVALATTIFSMTTVNPRHHLFIVSHHGSHAFTRRPPKDSASQNSQPSALLLWHHSPPVIIRTIQLLTCRRGRSPIDFLRPEASGIKISASLCTPPLRDVPAKSVRFRSVATLLIRRTARITWKRGITATNLLHQTITLCHQMPTERLAKRKWLPWRITLLSCESLHWNAITTS